MSANEVSAEYFRTLGIPLRRGRLFTDEDARSEGSPAVISEAMANRFWPGTDPMGKCFKDNGGTSYEIFLHNQSSLLLKGSLLFRKGVIVTSVPYHLEK